MIQEEYRLTIPWNIIETMYIQIQQLRTPSFSTENEKMNRRKFANSCFLLESLLTTYYYYYYGHLSHPSVVSTVASE